MVPLFKFKQRSQILHLFNFEQKSQISTLFKFKQKSQISTLFQFKHFPVIVAVISYLHDFWKETPCTTNENEEMILKNLRDFVKNYNQVNKQLICRQLLNKILSCY